MLLTTGEHEYMRYGFRELIARKAVDILQPDINWVGGITEARRIVAMAAAYDIPVIPHGSSVFSYHLQYAFTNCPMAEFLIMSPKADTIVPLFGDLFVHEPVPKDGWIDIPDTPGWGVELNRGAEAEAAIRLGARHRQEQLSLAISAHRSQRCLAPDGRSHRALAREQSRHRHRRRARHRPGHRRTPGARGRARRRGRSRLRHAGARSRARSPRSGLRVTAGRCDVGSPRVGRSLREARRIRARPDRHPRQQRRHRRPRRAARGRDRRRLGRDDARSTSPASSCAARR